MHPLSFGNQQWLVMADRALFWPAERALIVADLHFEKASWFARSGQYLPPYDSLATLTRLCALAERTGAAAIYCLGDNFHDDAGPERLPVAARSLLRQLAAGRRLLWITGNHDDGADFAGESCDEAEIRGIVLRHEARMSETRPELSGHFHPKVRIATAVRSIARPCLLESGNRLILPAFGALTGGLDVHDPVLQRLHGGSGRVHVATERRLLSMALAPAERRRRASAAPAVWR